MHKSDCRSFTSVTPGTCENSLHIYLIAHMHVTCSATRKSVRSFLCDKAAPPIAPKPAVASGSPRQVAPPRRRNYSVRASFYRLCFLPPIAPDAQRRKAMHRRRRSEKQEGCRIRQPFCENDSFYLHITSVSTSAGYLFAGVPFAVYFNTRVMVSPSIWSAQGFVNSTVISCPVRTSTVSL